MKKKYLIPLIIVAVLVILRIALEPAVTYYANKSLEDVAGYTGSIADVDINLYRGAYRIENLRLDKIGGGEQPPLFSVDTLDLSVEWGALLDGAIAGEVILSHPTLNFITSQDDADTTQNQTGESVAWQDQFKDFMPLTLNRLEVKRGEVTYRDRSMDPPVDATLSQLNLLATNLSNVNDTSYLPASLTARAITIGDGEVDLQMQMDFLQEIPNLKADLKINHVDLTQLNDFIKAYANFDVQEGSFTLVSELTIDSGRMDGYVKPFFENLDVFDFQKDVIEEKGFLGKLWEALVGIGAEVLENQKRDEVATKVPLQGDLNNPSPDVTATVFNVLRNAFVDAIEKEFDRQAQPTGSGGQP
ncbi:MAG: DUF748 domain-containing protein [Tunicatimonas sp.]